MYIYLYTLYRDILLFFKLDNSDSVTWFYNIAILHCKTFEFEYSNSKIQYNNIIKCITITLSEFLFIHIIKEYCITCRNKNSHSYKIK